MSAICHTDHVINSVPILSEHFSHSPREHHVGHDDDDDGYW